MGSYHHQQLVKTTQASEALCLQLENINYEKLDNYRDE